MLTQLEADRFWADGFIAVEEFIPADAVTELRRAFDEIIDGRVPSTTDRNLGGVIRQVLVPSMVHEAFEDNAAIQQARDVMRDLLQCATASRTYDMLIDKPPGSEFETPWHQDAGYYATPTAAVGTMAPMNLLQFWIALDDVDAENGCMEFLPGRHRDPLVAHEVVGGEPLDDGRLIAMVDRHGVAANEVVACPLPAGGATVHTALTPHRTGPNSTQDRPRRAYIFNLLASETEDRTIETFMREQYVRNIREQPAEARLIAPSTAP